MKVTIDGNNLTSENFAKVIDTLNDEYASLGIRVKNATCYIRFMDDDGNVVEPVQNGQHIEKKFTFRDLTPSEQKIKDDWIDWCREHKDEPTSKKAFRDAMYPDLSTTKLYRILAA